MREHLHCAHGTRTPTYNSWRAMIERCTYPKHPFYSQYGGRGIKVEPQWLGRGGFARFLADMGERPPGFTLDRINVNGPYSPRNCRWATPKGQRWNRRDMAAAAELAQLEFSPPQPAGQPADMPF